MPKQNNIDFKTDFRQEPINKIYHREKDYSTEKIQNAYVMPLNMIRDVDYIDPFRFYEK